MSRGVNKAIVVGNVGNPPEVRVFQGGGRKVSFSVATSDYWNDKKTGERQQRTEWHNIVCFGKVAEIAEAILQKGSKVYVEGAMQLNKWKDGNGVDRQRLEINCRQLEILDSRQAAQEADTATLPNNPTNEEPEDDIPF